MEIKYRKTENRKKNEIEADLKLVDIKIMKLARKEVSTPNNHTQHTLSNLSPINLVEDAQIGSVRLNTTYYSFLLCTLGRKCSTPRLFPSNAT